MKSDFWIFAVLVFCVKLSPAASIAFLIAPEDVATGTAAIYGFTPKIIKGNDHRFGFGFRFGNHADFQILYELGPQEVTRPIAPIRTRSATYRQRIVRRRPLLEFLLKAGIFGGFTEDNITIREEYEPSYEPR